MKMFSAKRPSGQHAMPATPSPHGKRRTLIVAIGIIAAILIMYAVALALTARSALGEIETIAAEATDLAGQVTAGDSAGALRSARDISEASARMEDSLSSPVMSVATVLPVIGADLARVQSLSSVASDLTANALVPMTKRLTENSLSDIAGDDGSINVASLGKLLGSLEEAAPAVQRATDTFNTLGEPNIGQLRKPLQTITQMMNLLNSVTSIAPDLADAIPNFLGAKGKRTYLVLAQTNAEIRSVGGMSGSYGKLVFDKGKLELGDFVGIQGYGGPEFDTAKAREERMVPITARERELFGNRFACEPRDANFNPDFPRFAEVTVQISEKIGFGTFDGVIALDPIFFQEVLSVIGSVTTSNGYTVDGTNAARMLLHDAYNIMPSYETDIFFAETAKLSFKQLSDNLSGSTIAGLASALANAMSDEHLLIWSKYADEEHGLEALECDGGLGKSESQPEAGVYFSAGGATKLSWYLSAETIATKTADNADGSKTYSMSVTLTNTMTSEEAQNDSDYVNGSGSWQRMRGDMPLWIFLFAPAGGRIDGLATTADVATRADEQTDYHWNPFYAHANKEGIRETSYQGLDLWYGLIRVRPGQTATFSYKVTTSPLAYDDLTARMTPTAAQYLKTKAKED